MSPRNPDLPPLLFQPRKTERRAGYCPAPSGREIFVNGYNAGLQPLLDLFREPGIGLRSNFSSWPSFGFGDYGNEFEEASLLWSRRQAETSAPGIREQAYVLIVGPAGGVALAGGAGGLFYAALTLRELLTDHGWPCCRIEDQPAVRNRCVLLDVSRARVPRPAALRRFVDLLALLRFNQLTFNIEHVLEPEEGLESDEAEILTPTEIRDLARYGRDRHLDLIPFQQSLGHLRGILHQKRYRHLAYDPELLWSLDPAQEESYDLLARLYDRQIEVTDSIFFHAGCDEPFDLMRRFNPDRFGGKSLAAVVMDHIVRVHRLLSERGRATMIWSDALPSSPDLLERLPEVILCDWHYGTGNREPPEFYRQKLAAPRPQREFYACAGTWSMTKLFPDLEVMRANNDGLFAAAKELKPLGIMTTIWGDLGHMSLLGLEALPLAYAARHGWEDQPEPRDIALPAARLLYGERGATAARLPAILDGLNRALAGPFGMGGVGLLLFFAEPLSTAPLPPAFDPGAGSVELRALAGEAAAALAAMETAGLPRRDFWLDHHLPALQAEFLAQKLAVIQVLRSAWNEGGDPAEAFRIAGEGCGRAVILLTRGLALLESRWLANNKESGFAANRARWRRLVRAWQEREVELAGYGEGLRAGRKPPPLERVLSQPPGGYIFNPLAEMGLAGLLG
jgi:hypothetical protein